ncbi:MAG: zinc-ribbon domain-containing protein [Syntrophomonadaceae bacterium]
MYCGKCGSAINPGSTFCSSCGTAVEMTPGFSTAGNNQSKSLPKYLIGALLLGIGIYFAYTLFWQDQPRNVVYKFYAAWNEKDVEAMLACVDPKYEAMYNVGDKVVGGVVKEFTGVDIGLKDISSLLPFMYDFSKNNSNKVVDKVTVERIESEVITGDEATVKATFSSQNSAGQKLHEGIGIIYLKKFNEGWRIVDIK